MGKKYQYFKALGYANPKIAAAFLGLDEANVSKMAEDDLLEKVAGCFLKMPNDQASREVKLRFHFACVNGEYRAPDHGGDQEKFQILLNAKACLMKESERKAYCEHGDKNDKDKDDNQQLNPVEVFVARHFHDRNYESRLHIANNFITLLGGILDYEHLERYHDLPPAIWEKLHYSQEFPDQFQKTGYTLTHVMDLSKHPLFLEADGKTRRREPLLFNLKLLMANGLLNPDVDLAYVKLSTEEKKRRADEGNHLGNLTYLLENNAIVRQLIDRKCSFSQFSKEVREFRTTFVNEIAKKPKEPDAKSAAAADEKVVAASTLDSEDTDLLFNLQRLYWYEKESIYPLLTMENIASILPRKNHTQMWALLGDMDFVDRWILQYKESQGKFDFAELTKHVEKFNAQKDRMFMHTGLERPLTDDEKFQLYMWTSSNYTCSHNHELTTVFDETCSWFDGYDLEFMGCEPTADELSTRQSTHDLSKQFILFPVVTDGQPTQWFVLAKKGAKDNHQKIDITKMMVDIEKRDLLKRCYIEIVLQEPTKEYLLAHDLSRSFVLFPRKNGDQATQWFLAIKDAKGIQKEINVTQFLEGKGVTSENVENYKSDVDFRSNLLHHIRPHLNLDPVISTDNVRDYRNQILKHVRSQLEPAHTVDRLTQLKWQMTREVLDEYNQARKVKQDLKTYKADVRDRSSLASVMDARLGMIAQVFSRGTADDNQYTNVMRNVEFQYDTMKQQIQRLGVKRAHPTKGSSFPAMKASSQADELSTRLRGLQDQTINHMKELSDISVKDNGKGGLTAAAPTDPNAVKLFKPEIKHGQLAHPALAACAKNGKESMARVLNDNSLAACARNGKETMAKALSNKELTSARNVFSYGGKNALGVLFVSWWWYTVGMAGALVFKGTKGVSSMHNAYCDFFTRTRTEVSLRRTQQQMEVAEQVAEEKANQGPIVLSAGGG